MKWLKSVFGNEENNDATDGDKSSQKSISFSFAEDRPPSQPPSKSLQLPDASDQVHSTWAGKEGKSGRKSILLTGNNNSRPTSPKEIEPKKKLLFLAASNDRENSPSQSIDGSLPGSSDDISNVKISTTVVEVTPDGAVGSDPMPMGHGNASEEEQKEVINILDDLQNILAESRSITPSDKGINEHDKSEDKATEQTSNYSDEVPKIVLMPVSSEQGAKKWESLDAMERRFMDSLSLEEDNAFRMEFDLQVLKSQIMKLRQQNRKHTFQIKKWNLDELREEVHKLSEQQELLEKAMLQDHVIQQSLNHIRSLKYLGRMEAIRNYGKPLELSDLLSSASGFEPREVSPPYPEKDPKHVSSHDVESVRQSYSAEDYLQPDDLPTYHPRFYGKEMSSSRRNLLAENGLHGLETLYDHSINYNKWEADRRSEVYLSNQMPQKFYLNQSHERFPKYHRSSSRSIKHSTSPYKKSRSSSAKSRYRKPASSKYR